MRTTLDLPEELLEKAMQVSNTNTKTKVIILALGRIGAKIHHCRSEAVQRRG